MLMIVLLCCYNDEKSYWPPVSDLVKRGKGVAANQKETVAGLFSAWTVAKLADG